jgi:hypothetical protein
MAVIVVSCSPISLVEPHPASKSACGQLTSHPTRLPVRRIVCEIDRPVTSALTASMPLMLPTVPIQ